jgi:hypothetical protein
MPNLGKDEFLTTFLPKGAEVIAGVLYSAKITG